MVTLSHIFIKERIREVLVLDIYYIWEELKDKEEIQTHERLCTPKSLKIACHFFLVALELRLSDSGKLFRFCIG